MNVRPLTYVDHASTVKVFDGDRHIGTIVKLAAGFYYVTRGPRAIGGPVFETIDDVKQSLER